MFAYLHTHKGHWHGQGFVEYALLIMLVSLVAVGSLSALGNGVVRGSSNTPS